MKIKPNIDRWAAAFGILIVITFAVKIVLILDTPGPILYLDEWVYKKGAMELFYEQRYLVTNYPPMYSLFLSAAFLFGDFYTAMKVINAALAAAAYLAVWKICRLFIDRKNSFMCVSIITLLPWQYTICTSIMSENLYFPLLFWTLYFFLKLLFDSNITLKKCIFLGMLFASLQLTRYITIVILPVFALIWIIGLGENKKWRICWNRQKIVTGLAILCGYGVIYGGWVMIRLLQGYPFEKILGLQVSNGIGSDAVASYATGTSLLSFIILYAAYLVLAVLYTFSMNIFAVQESIKGEFEERYAKTVFLFMGISAMLFVAAVRHSWRATYNYPKVAYILGRYLIYIPAMWIILTKVLENKIDFMRNKKKNLICQAAEVLLLILSVLILVKGCFFDLRNGFLDSFSTKEICYLYRIYGLVICLVFVKLIVLIWKKQWYMKTVHSFLILVFLLGSIITMEGNEWEKRGCFGAELSEFANKNDMKQVDFLINDTPAVDLNYDMTFWSTPETHLLMPWTPIQSYDRDYKDYHKKIQSYDNSYKGYHKIRILNSEQVSELQSEKGSGLVFCEVSDKYLEKPDANCAYLGKTYGIYHYPVALQSPAKSVEIVQTYPDHIIPGEGFNLDENGASGFAIQTKGEEGIYEVWINREYYKDIVIGENGLGSFIMEPEFYKEEGTLSVQVREKYAPYVKTDFKQENMNIYQVEICKEKQ